MGTEILTDMNKFKKIGKVKIIKGSILTPHNAGLRLVLSVANMAGKPENPLYPIFDKKWRRVREDARGWFTNKNGFYKLGAVNTTCVQSDAWVMHMLCQDENLKVDLAAVETCLQEVVKTALYENATIHISNILVGLIPELPSLVEKHILQKGVNVDYYDEV